MPAPDPILSLIERFEFHRQAYILGKYNETQLRREFVDKFFSALGWDVDNNKGFSEKYKEVMHEEPVWVRGTTLFFDYTFRVGGARKFIVETKKPSVRIKDAAEAALQLRRYAWNQKLPLSILTNFEEFAIYDCRIKPENGDAASKARIEYFTFKEYPEKWDWLVSIIAPDSILRGSFDTYAETTKGKRGTASVDDDILAEIEEWRDALAKNIALRNPSLTVEELNSVVQRTIDRILFLRICEDRGIEEYETLHKLLEGEKVYERLSLLFRYADDKYNSGLFHFQQEPDWDESPDTLSLTVAMDDKVLKGIIKRLYFPDSQYEFSLIPPAILGHVYEQFLGKVIRLTEGHQAKVEYKPEVKKAGGVFYTPQYIVEYIVKHTVGELVKDKTPREVSKIRILDPACGSGSFLIGAYQYLLDWHRDWYIANLVPVFKDKNSVTDPVVQALLPEQAPKKKKSAASIDLPIYKPGNSKEVRLSERVRSDWKLTTAEKKRILLNNIFGVDIDQQAVEVTKLSLLLKVLEEENQETVSKQLTITAERALPSLDHNIKCGNSLIGWDILTPEMPTDEVKRINPFDWSKEFAPVMAAGGFDAVIGNPPYIRIQTMKEWAPTEVEVYKKKFLSASKGNYDIYVVFVEKGLSLLNKNGLLGYILPHKFFNAQYGEPLRSVIANGKHLKEIVHFGHQQVFENATTYTCLLFLGKKGYEEFHFNKVDDLTSWRSSQTAIVGIISSKNVSEKEWNFVVGNDSGLFKKLESERIKLKDVTAKIFQGLVTGADPVFIVVNQEDGSFYSEATGKKHSLERDLLHPLCKGALNIRRYCIDIITKSILFPYKIVENKATLLSTKELSENYPNTWEYFKQNRSLLEARENGKWKHEQWYAFGRNQNLTEMDREKILTPSIANGACFTFDSKDFFYFMGSGGGGGGGYGIILKPEEKMSYLYLLGLLNSALSTFYLKKTSSTFRGGYIALNRQYIEQLPIRTINFADPLDKARHDRMVALVTQMLDLNKKLQEARLEQERTMLSRQIAATDAAIDKLVYDLYGLTEDEIRIVEGKTGS
jgi:type I restriction-modification system DNA methylase subunit